MGQPPIRLPRGRGPRQPAIPSVGTAGAAGNADEVEADLHSGHSPLARPGRRFARCRGGVLSVQPEPGVNKQPPKDPRNLPMLELFRVEVENQTAILTSGLLELERGQGAPGQLEILM